MLNHPAELWCLIQEVLVGSDGSRGWELLDRLNVSLPRLCHVGESMNTSLSGSHMHCANGLRLCPASSWGHPHLRESRMTRMCTRPAMGPVLLFCCPLDGLLL